MIDALLAAGGEIQPNDPLYPLTQGAPKALLPIAGKPMAQWVLDALAGSDRIGQVVVVGLQPECGLQCKGKPLDYIASVGNIVDNLRAGLERILQLNPQAKYALSVSADIPAVRTEHIDWLLEMCQQTDHDVYYAVIQRQVMERRYPASRRSYTRLKNTVVCGGDITLLATHLAQGGSQLWEKVTAARKNVFKQAALVGFEMLFLLATRQLTIDHAAQLASRRLGVRGRAIVCPYAEVGMDVDKPAQYEILAKALAG